MRPLIATFTDFGLHGPYLGQVKAVFLREAPGVPVVDLLADAPAFDPRASAYLLAALAPEMPAGAVLFCVVDPGVGGARAALVAEIDGRFYVGPDNGLFEPLMRRAATVTCWDVRWRPERLSATFHGRDLFAPIAARLARGLPPEFAGCRPCSAPRRPDWPDDLAEIVYVDHYGNAFTGLRAATMPDDAVIVMAGRRIAKARTYGDVPPGAPFWYANSSGLVEVAVNGGSAADALHIRTGLALEITR